MEREKLNEWIVRYNEGTLSGDELESFLRMLENDESLRKEVLVDKEINRMLEERDLLELRKAIINARKKNNPGQRHLFLLAAVLILVLAVGSALLIRNFTSEREEPVPVVSNPRQDTAGHAPENAKQVMPREPEKMEDSKEQLLADNFTPDPAMESLVSETTRADGITLEEPASVTVVKKGKEVKFRWTAEINSTVELLLIDNRGNKMKPAGSKAKDGYHLQTTSLQPGLYYWKLLMNGQLVTIGKLRVE